MDLIVVPRRDCPSGCGPAASDNCDYDCPACGAKFCSICAKKDYTGPGTYLICPKCGQKLDFPLELRMHP